MTYYTKAEEELLEYAPQTKMMLDSLKELDLWKARLRLIKFMSDLEQDRDGYKYESKYWEKEWRKRNNDWHVQNHELAMEKNKMTVILNDLDMFQKLSENIGALKSKLYVK